MSLIANQEKLLKSLRKLEEKNKELCEQLAKANERVRELEKGILEEIENRDNREEWLDKLSNEIARYFGVDIGEHSSANNPWLEAFEAIPEGTLNKFAIENQIKALEWFEGNNLMEDETTTLLLERIEKLRKGQSNDR